MNTGKNNLGIEERLVGISDSIRYIRSEIIVMAPSTIPILVMGETGTGKEIIAKELHAASKRSRMPFLPVNCATLGTLAGSELFGHVKGAFTGALRSTSGYVGASNGGTLFLDEIESLSIDIQAKLLRFLDSGEYFKVGDPRILCSDVRLISASNKGIEELCESGNFRQDLFYRISGATIETTPLRARREDIPVLSSHFLRLFAMNAGRESLSIHPDAMETLAAHEWPGNARQLKQVIHNLYERNKNQGSISGKEVSRLLGTPAKDVEFPSYQAALSAGLDQLRQKYFKSLLSLTHGKSKKALELSKMNRKNFYAALRKLGLSPKDFR